MTSCAETTLTYSEVWRHSVLKVLRQCLTEGVPTGYVADTRLTVKLLNPVVWGTRCNFIAAITTYPPSVVAVTTLPVCTYYIQ